MNIFRTLPVSFDFILAAATPNFLQKSFGTTLHTYIPNFCHVHFWLSENDRPPSCCANCPLTSMYTLTDGKFMVESYTLNSLDNAGCAYGSNCTMKSGV